MLEVEGLSIAFQRYTGLLRRDWLEPVRGIDLRVAGGELVALVGASGAGKSLLAHALLGILPANAHVHGKLAFDGQPLTPARLAALRGRQIALVPQALTFLDPLANARRQVGWAAQAAGVARAGAATAAATELRRYGLGAIAAGLYPHQLSGGMARRVLTAIATVAPARLLIADEPTSGLDPEVSGLTLGHLRALADGGRGVLVITHDLQAVLPHADRLVIVDAGRSVETTTTADFFAGRLQHPYSQALRAALPTFGFAGAAAVAGRPVGGDGPDAPDLPDRLNLPDSAAMTAMTAGPGRPGVLAGCDKPAPPAPPAPTRPPHGGPVLSAQGLGHRWPGAAQPLFQGIGLQWRAGEWLALQGRSGSGKTTLARLLAGQIALQQGHVSVATGPGPQRCNPVQWLHQHAELAFNPRRRVGHSLQEGWSPDATTLRRFGIEAAWLQRYPHELSGGELQRLNIVRALVPNLRVLIADEMTAMHDTITQARLWGATRDTLAGRDVAVVVISHDDALVDALGARRLNLGF